MPLTSLLLPLATAALAASRVSALDDGFGRTPLMGWNSYNQYSCSPSESTMQATINALKANGFVDAGYKLFQIDCGWQATNRTATGEPAINTNAFPNGLQGLANSTRANGMQWAMYTDMGVYACDTRSPPPFGSLGHEATDAAWFKQFGTVSVKLDNCWITPDQDAPKDPRTDFVSRYGNMTSALRANGIEGATLCQWGVPYISSTGLQGPAQWAPSISTAYRLSDDITNDWVSVVRISNQAMNIAHRSLIGPGAFADADLLEVGNNALTFDEQKSHFALWAMLKSPLMISTNVVSPSNQTMSILLNKGLIAINQDSLGKPIVLAQRWSNNYDLYTGPLANGDLAVLLVEQGGNAGTKTIDFVKNLNISSADVTDLWSGASRTGASSWSATVGAHGNIALRLSNIRAASTAAPKYTYYEAESAALSNGANVASCSACSGGKKAGYVGTVTFNNVTTSQTTSNVLFDYINADVQYSFANMTNARGASVSVNGGPATQIYFPLSGYNWDQDVWRSFAVELTGFKPGQQNTIAISGGTYLSQYAPDLDRIGVVSA